MTTTKKLAVTCLFALSAIPALANSPLNARIPFEFTVSGHTLPAGEYTITPPSGLVRVTKLMNVETGKVSLAAAPVFAAWESTQQPGEPKLTFSCLAGRCALSGMTAPTGTAEFYPNLKLTSREKESLAKQEVALTPKGQ